MNPFRMNPVGDPRFDQPAAIAPTPRAPFRRRPIAGLLVAIVGLAVTASFACTPGQREEARTVLDVAKVACIVANQALPDSKVAEICDIANPFFKPMADILTSARHQTDQAKASARAEALASVASAGRAGCVGADAGAR